MLLTFKDFLKNPILQELLILYAGGTLSHNLNDSQENHL